ncbi:MAG: sigma-70 family RNA polymerase sigma factor [Phycisphaerales bacterium]|nr:sigma-70 family RNA polymerase sigma factor [Phycisphaerales bacterium]
MSQIEQAVFGTVEPPSLGGLIEQMRSGDRAAAARFVEEYGPRVRRRLRSKLSRAMRRVFDSQDLMSTFARRLDAFVHARKLQATTEGQFWSLVFQMAEHALIDKGRVFRRLLNTEAEDGPLAQRLHERMSAAEDREDGAELEIAATLDLLPDSTDRAILSLWLSGTPHAVTADCVGLSPAAVRQRWSAIRARLRAGLGG